VKLTVIDAPLHAVFPLERLMKISSHFLVVGIVYLGCCIHPSGISQVFAQTVLSHWDGTTGNWSEGTRWIPPGTVPNDTPSTKFSVTINSGMVTTDIPIVVTDLLLNGGQLRLNENLRAGVLTLDSGSIVGPAALAVDGDLVLRSALINNTAGGPTGFTVGGAVVKRGYGPATLAPFGGGGDYDIRIEQGKFRYGNGGLGSLLGTTAIVASEFARIETLDTAGLADDVYLNNARGFAGTGAIVSSQSRSSLIGDFYLGEIGSVVGLNSGAATFFGDVHGGAIDVVGSGTLNIESAGNDYSGRTTLRSGGTDVLVRLRNQGRLLATPVLDIGARTTLRLDNETQLVNDRLPDAARIELRGGTVELLSDSVVPASERAGELHLLEGASALSTGGWRANLFFSRLEREAAATIDFQLRTDFTAEGPGIKFDDPLGNVHGILGGWATVKNRDFAAYDPVLGVVPLGTRAPRPAQINSAGHGDHVLVPPGGAALQPLTADRTIGTLAINVTGTVDIDLGGHTLTLRDGGYLRNGDGDAAGLVHNGQLTAGDSSVPANLYLRTTPLPASPGSEGVRISASIVDNPAGGAVSIVRSGNFAVTLSGTNSYSGQTIIQDSSSLIFATEGALPDGGDLILDGGSARFEYDPTVSKQLASLALKQRGSLFAPKSVGDYSDIQIDAESYELESGTLSISLTGNGTVRKLTDGVVELEYESPNFDGPIFVERGVLVAGSHLAVVSVPRALGNGETTILPDGILVHGAKLPSAGHMQLDAKLHLAGGDVGLGLATATTRWDFNGEWRITADSRLLLFDPFGNDEIRTPAGIAATATVNLLQSVGISDNAGLTMLGPGGVHFAGGLTIAGNVSLAAPEAAVHLSSVSAAVQASTLHLRGGGAFEIPNTLAPGIGEEFTVEIAEGATASPSLGDFTLAEGVTLNVNGQLANSDPLTVLGGTITGSGIIGNVINDNGEIAPGNSVGVLTVDNYEQGSAGVLSIELLGGPDASSDKLRADVANVSGTVNAMLAPGASVVAGNEFHILIADQILTGGLILQPFGFDGRLDVITLSTGPDAGKQALRLLVVPEPTAGLLGAIAFFSMVLRKRSGLRRHSPFVNSPEKHQKRIRYGSRNPILATVENTSSCPRG
jgi:hypothetical protein